MICIPPMGGWVTRVAVAGWLVAAALTGCSSGGDPALPTATLGTAPPVTPTTDPYAVPAVIDAAYVNRILEGLDAAMGDVVRTIVRERTIPYDTAVRLQAMYIDNDAWQLVIDSLQGDVQSGLNGYPSNPGNKRTTVTKLLSATGSCVFALRGLFSVRIINATNQGHALGRPAASGSWSTLN